MPQTIPYNKLINYIHPSAPDFENLKKTTKHYPVFLSSRFKGMSEIRKIIAEKFEYYGFPVLGWEVGESFGSTNKNTPRETYLDKVIKSKIYCGVMDDSYGNPIIESPTEDEYNHAIECGLDLCLLVGKTEPKEKGANKLINKWKSNHTVDFYNSSSHIGGILDKFIKNILLKYSLNWLMLGDVITQGKYNWTNNQLTINFYTTDYNIVKNFRSKIIGQRINFIDLSDGHLIVAELLKCSIDKETNSIWHFTIEIKEKIKAERMLWSRWEKSFDINMNACFEKISGRPRIPQVLQIALNINRGEFVMQPEMGSNLYNILKDYHDFPELAEILIKFDTIETLTFPKIDTNNKQYPPLQCLERIASLKVRNITANKVTIDLELDINGLNDNIFETVNISWENKSVKK